MTLPKWISKKVIATLLGTFLVPILQKYGVPQETINWIIGLLMAYVGAQGAVDVAKAFSFTDTSGK